MATMTILLALRPSLTRNEYQAAIVRRGFHVLVADDGAQCSIILGASLPDVLVLEPELPRGGGEGVLEAFHERLEAHHVPVFVLTTERNRSAMYRISRFTISNFSVGPVVAEQLADRVAWLATERRTISA